MQSRLTLSTYVTPVRHLLAERAYSLIGLPRCPRPARHHPLIPAHAKHNHNYDPVLYRQRHKIDNTFAHVKHWRRIHTRQPLRSRLPCPLSLSPHFHLLGSTR
ncbi:hypothetical protein MESS4_60094 [Mesorhizobium sp. STM 4661]|nr:hypothetical protein MESS4_60094 [Mesorhizobium sp. STM 4661]